MQQLPAAIGDVAEGLRRWRGWTYLALETIKSQYRRTVLGPWWLTIQTGVYIIALAAVFGQIRHQPLHQFLPYVAMGFMGFNLLSTLTQTASSVFVRAAGTMQSARQPLSAYVLRDITIALIQFAHNLVLYFALMAAGLVPLTPKALISIPIVLAIAANGFFAALWLGPAVARFRDIDPLVDSIMRIMIFFTPIFYQPAALGSRGVLLKWNPFTYLLDAFRSPLIGTPLEAKDYLITLAITAFNVGLAAIVFSRARSRVPYWIA
jgi:ABC-2 type transport system permease protein/lipopolysaccharide transport system permease protein